MFLTNWLADTFRRQRWMVVVVVVLISVLAASGFAFPKRSSLLRSQGDVDDDVADDERYLQQVDQHFRVGAPDAFLLLTSDDMFTSPNLAAVERAIQAVKDLPYVDSVGWIGDMPVVNAFALADPLLPESDAPPGRIAAMKQRAIDHPLAAQRQISADGNALLATIRYDWLAVGDDYDAADRVLEAARKAADAGRHSVRMGLTGRAPLFLAQHQALERNQVWFQVIGYALSFITAALLFRGVVSVLIVASAPCLGVLWTLGLLRLLGEETNPMTDAILPVLLSMVGMSDGVHIMMHIRRRRSEGDSPIESATHAIRDVGLACALTSLTTAIGFGSLLVAHSEFVRSFGRACAIGVMIVFVAVVTLIPLLSSTRLGLALTQERTRDPVADYLRKWLGAYDWILAQHRWVTGFAVVTTLAFTLYALQLRPDDRLAYGIPSRSAAYKTLDECDRLFGGIEPVRLVVEWGPQTPNDSPEILRAVDAAEQRLASVSEFAKPLSLLDLLRLFPGEPTDLEARMRFVALLPVRLRDQFMDLDERRLVINTRIQDLGIARYQPIFRELRKDLEALSAEHPGFQFRMTGDAVIRGKRLNQIVWDLTNSLGMAAVVILVVMGITYRSLRLGLITIIPNVFPLAVTAVLLLWTGRALELASVCAFTVCLGIAVDDTIHFLTRYELEVRKPGSLSDALRRTFVGVGSALVTTTLILVLGFATVLTSDLPSHRTFAAMACATIAAALVGDLVFLPAMLMAWPGRPRRERDSTKSTENDSLAAPLPPSASADANLVGKGQE